MPPKSTVVVIPTYNERENLESLVQEIVSLGIPNLKIIIVDDNSPDGTGELAEKLKKHQPLRVIHRPRQRGLGTAYTAAFREILKDSNNQPDFIIQMDADWSHDPRVIPKMIKAADYADAVIGSRYTKGGRIDNWSFSRRLLSRFANLYARAILGLPYRDLTSGFRLYRRKVIQKLLGENLSSVGYAFQIETAYLAQLSGFKISEIPITFTERKLGQSKLKWQIIFESFIKVLKWRFKKISGQKSPSQR